MERDIVYGVTRMTTDPRRQHRPFRIRRYFGWAQDKTASDGAFMPTRPHLFRASAALDARILALDWSKAARPAGPGDAPPSGYGLEEWEERTVPK